MVQKRVQEGFRKGSDKVQKGSEKVQGAKAFREFTMCTF
jgi:hypothetical protein